MTAAALAPLPDRLPRGRILRLASADYGFNLFWQSLELFLLFYYTDVLGLPPLFTGLVLTLGSVCDALVDPVIGSLADRTRTRWGRFRPLVVLAAPVTALGLIASFSPPATSSQWLMTYVLVSHLFFRTAYTAGSIPYIALSARAVADTQDRSLLSGRRMQFAGIAALTVSMVYPFFVDRAGDASGYRTGAIALALLAIPVMWQAMAGTREDACQDADPPVEETRSRTDDLRAFGRIVRHNTTFVRLLIAIVMLSMTGTLISKMTLFYYKYVAQAPEMGRYGLAVSAVSMLLVAPIWAIVANRTSKRTAWMVASAFAIAGLLGLYVVPAGNGPLTLAVFFTVGIGTTGFSVMFWSMVPDTVEVNQHLFGERYEAKTVAIAMFARKMTLAINSLIIGSVLALVGYTPDAHVGPETVAAMRGLIVLLPIGCVIVSVLAMAGYRLDEKEHRRLRGLDT